MYIYITDLFNFSNNAEQKSIASNNLTILEFARLSVYCMWLLIHNKYNYFFSSALLHEAVKYYHRYLMCKYKWGDRTF